MGDNVCCCNVYWMHTKFYIPFQIFQRSLLNWFLGLRCFHLSRFHQFLSILCNSYSGKQNCLYLWRNVVKRNPWFQLYYLVYMDSITKTILTIRFTYCESIISLTTSFVIVPINLFSVRYITTLWIIAQREFITKGYPETWCGLSAFRLITKR